MSDTIKEAALRSALERVTNNYRLTLAGKSVRDVTETLAEADASLAAAPAPVPAEPSDDQLTGAYWQGWCEAADWAQRDDLYADRDSQAYADAMNRRLGPIRGRSAPVPASPVSAAAPEAMRELERALCVIGIVGTIDGHAVIRRDSVLEIVRDRIKRGDK